jgi:adenylate cyclase
MVARRHHIKLKSQIEKIIWITLIWALLSLFQFLFGYARLDQFDCVPNDIGGLIIGIILAGTIVGLIGGSFIVFYWENWLRTKSYGLSLFNIFWSYTIIYFVVSVITGMFYQSDQLNLSIFHKEVWQQIWMDISGINNVQNFLFWLIVFIITLITLMVNDKYGPGVFVSFLRGKYFHPKREERIFMFLDLSGATTIAEKLGEEDYFNFLRDVYRDATPEILNSKGEIYQYVGDEIVISWEKESGIQNANCLQCFFDIQQSLLDKASYYREKYNEIGDSGQKSLACDY